MKSKNILIVSTLVICVLSISSCDLGDSIAKKRNTIGNTIKKSINRVIQENNKPRNMTIFKTEVKRDIRRASRLSLEEKSKNADKPTVIENQADNINIEVEVATNLNPNHQASEIDIAIENLPDHQVDRNHTLSNLRGACYQPSLVSNSSLKLWDVAF
ncbi:hypothetical protein Q7L83_04485 [Candidatus Liberibacter asiaticus]|uniref:Lipoprotein n=1 Tax=Candidatus Liberibacter asiaticus str. gxpsy TaxID=1174529 RepID=A0ABN4B6R3_LIBAS|nr:hypothetical protein [Candidatus Liberibacter asiaticus]AGH17249.1 hypothetical protein WSI_04395 [Candidatus Liberibacter asiaticus str. gxpsy]